MKVVLFTDTHFGCKGGSRTWFNYQSAFIYKQLIPELTRLKKTEDEVVLIHLGDVFDSRSTLNTMIATDVRKMFQKLASIVDRFYVIPGNHDYFSEQSDVYCTPELLLSHIDNLKVVDTLFFINVGLAKLALVPWHYQKEYPMVELTKRYPEHYIFTHADIIAGSPKLSAPVFSGHIHTPYINGNVRNLGSCYPIDFHDCNQQRYFYIWDPEEDKLTRTANKHSIRFWRWKDEEVLSANINNIGKDDYIELYVSASLMTDQQYLDKLAEFKKYFKNVWTIPIPETLVGDEIDINCDIESIIEQSIPEELMPKFNEIKEKIYGNNESNTKG